MCITLFLPYLHCMHAVLHCFLASLLFVTYFRFRSKLGDRAFTFRFRIKLCLLSGDDKWLREKAGNAGGVSQFRCHCCENPAVCWHSILPEWIYDEEEVRARLRTVDRDRAALISLLHEWAKQSTRTLKGGKVVLYSESKLRYIYACCCECVCASQAPMH